MDKLSIVQGFYTLAKKPEFRDGLVSEIQGKGCLPSLILLMDENDSDVIQLILKTLKLLAEHVPNRKIMYNEFGLMSSLKSLSQGITFIDVPEIKKRATTLYNQLHSAGNPRHTNSHHRIHTVSPTSQKFFVGVTNKRAKLIVLHVNGLNDNESKRLCEEYLLKVKGVVSFTFDMDKHRCMVRVIQSVSAETICNAIGCTNYLSAEQVIKNKSGEEVIVSFGHHPNVPDDEKAQQEEDLPEYLPEEDPIETSKTAVARPGDKESGSSGWFAGVSNFISSNLYW